MHSQRRSHEYTHSYETIFRRISVEYVLALDSVLQSSGVRLCTTYGASVGVPNTAIRHTFNLFAPPTQIVV